MEESRGGTKGYKQQGAGSFWRTRRVTSETLSWGEEGADRLHSLSDKFSSAGALLSNSQKESRGEGGSSPKGQWLSGGRNQDHSFTKIEKGKTNHLFRSIVEIVILPKKI